MANAVVKNREGSTKQADNQSPIDVVKIIVPALAVRLAWIFFGAWESGDSAWYINVARNIASHHVFSSNADGLTPTAFRPPLYPTVIAMLWFGDSAPIYAVLLLQVILGAATVALVYLIAHDQFGRGVAVLASAGMALAPMTNHFTAVVLSETLFTFLLTLGVFLWGRKRDVSAGIIFGLAALARVTMLPFVVMLPLVTLLRPWRSQRRPYATIMLLSLAVASIWMVRNAIVFHRFIPVAASGYGTNLLLGSMPVREADNVTTRRALLGSVDAVDGEQSGDETEFDRVRLRAAVRRIADNPGRWIVARVQQYPRLFIDSGSYMFGDGSTPFRTALRERRTGQVIVRAAFIGGNVLVFLFASLGMIAERDRLLSLSHITLFPIFLCVISLPLWIEPRYGLPMMPLVSILAAVGVLDLLKRCQLRTAGC